MEYLTRSLCPPLWMWVEWGGMEVLVEEGWKGVGSTVYYLSCRVGVSCSIGSQKSGNWYFPMFLLSEGSLTQVNMASLMFLVLPCGSLCIMVKPS